MLQQIFISFVIFVFSSSSSFDFFFFASFASFEAERAVAKEFLPQKKFITHTQKRSREEEEEEVQNVSIWRRQRKQIVFVRSAIQSLPGLVHRPLGVGQRGQNHPTTERVGQIVATRRLGFPDVVQH